MDKEAEAALREFEKFFFNVYGMLFFLGKFYEAEGKRIFLNLAEKHAGKAGLLISDFLLI